MKILNRLVRGGFGLGVWFPKGTWTIIGLLVIAIGLGTGPGASGANGTNDVPIWSDDFNDGVLDLAWTATGWSSSNPDTTNNFDAWAERNGVLDMASDRADYGIAKIYRSISITEDGTYYYKGTFYTYDQGSWAAIFFGFKIPGIDPYPYPYVELQGWEDLRINTPYVSASGSPGRLKLRDDTWYDFRIEIDTSGGQLVSYRTFVYDVSGNLLKSGSGSGSWNIPTSIGWWTDALWADGTWSHRQRAYFDDAEFGKVLTNAPPTANADGPYSVDEGSSVTLNGSGTDPNGDPLTFSWDLDNNGSFETAGQNPTFSAAGRDGPSSQTVVLRVCDNKGACATSSTTVNITNVAPTANADGPYSVNEGSSVGLTGSGTDPGPDTLTFSWDLDDNGTYETSGQNPTFSAAGLDGPSTKTVRLQVCDDDGACTTATTTVNILNVPPTITSVTNTGPINEGSSATIMVTASDPAGANDSLSYQFDCNNDGIYEIGPQAGNSASCTFGDNGSFQVNVRVTDGDGGVDTDSTTVMVSNVPPTVNAGPDAMLFSGQNHTVNATFTDPGLPDTHTATINWGDGSPLQNVAVVQGQGSGSLSASHQYFVPGTYTITVCVTDKDGGQGCDTLELEVERLPVQIDIKPGSFPNSINLKSKGVIPVAILTTASFDATAVLPSTVCFGDAEAPGERDCTEAHGTGHVEDVDGDSDLDMVLHYETQQTGIDAGDTQACLTGQTSGNIHFEGCDGIHTVP